MTTEGRQPAIPQPEGEEGIIHIPIDFSGNSEKPQEVLVHCDADGFASPSLYTDPFEEHGIGPS